MATYTIDEGTFDVPAEWVDKSINVFTFGSSLPLALSVVVTREQVAPEKDLAAYAEERLDDVAQQVKDFKIVEQREIEVAGQVALEAEFTWRSEAGLMYQRQTYVRARNKVLVFTATARRELRDSQRAQMDALLSSVKLA